jgi:hypothetical protein
MSNPSLPRRIRRHRSLLVALLLLSPLLVFTSDRPAYAAVTIPSGLKTELSKNFRSWSQVRNSCDTAVKGDFDRNGATDYALLLTHKNPVGGRAQLVVGRRLGKKYRLTVVYSYAGSEIRNAALGMNPRGNPVIDPDDLGNPDARTIVADRDLLIRSTCQTDEAEYLRFDGAEFRPFPGDDPVVNAQAPGTTDGSAAPTTQPALAGGCLYSERFTIPQGQNSYDLDLPIPTITAPIRIGFMQNRGPSVADPDPRWPDFQIPLSLRTFDRVRNPDRGSSTEVLAVETSGRGNVLPTWYRVVFPTNAAVGFGNDEEVFTNVIQPSSHNTIHVRAWQGVGVGPNATMSYRIRVIGGTCGGNAQNP